jgi:hypothetical protein
MKKLIVLSMILVMVTGLCFAETEKSEPSAIELFDLEIYAGFPVHWTNAKHGQDFYWFNPDYVMEDKAVTANTAIGFSMNFNFTRKVGLNLDADFFYGAKISGFSNPSSDYISMFGTNVLLGPVFYLYNDNFLRIPLTVGGHLYYFSDDLWMPNLVGYDPQNPSAQNTAGYWTTRRDLQIGPGISLGVQFHFSENIYIFSRTNVVMDLFRWHSINYIADDGTGAGTNMAKSKSETEFVIGWGVKPVIGLGIKF